MRLNQSNKEEAVDEPLRSALRRLLSDPASRRLFASGRQPGLFPSNTPTTRTMVEEMEQRGWIQIHQPSGKAAYCELTAKGRDWLLEHENPWLLLEDLLTATERQAEQVDDLLRTWQEQRDLLQKQSEDIRRVLARLDGDNSPSQSEIGDRIKEALSRHALRAEPAACSLCELFHQVQQADANLSVGRFHDELRELHRRGDVAFTPWTGPLYELPEPHLALLIGHEVLYYVRLRRSNAA